MNNVKDAFSKAVYKGAEFLKSAFNVASGQWLLDKITNDEGVHYTHGGYKDRDGLEIYDEHSRDFATFTLGLTGGIGGMLFGIGILLGGKGFGPALLGCASIYAASTLAAGNIHAGIAGASYSLRKFYNEGARLFKEDSNDQKILTSDSTHSHATENDYNGPDERRFNL